MALAVLAVLIAAYHGPELYAAWSAYETARARPVRAPSGAYYRVHLVHAGPEEAAAMLARLNTRAAALLRRLRRYRERPAGHPGRKVAEALLRRYNPDSIVESSPLNRRGDTSFTVSKGQTLALCLRERNPRRSGDPELHDFHDEDLLFFVMLHEMAHLGVEVWDHPPPFWEAFKFLLEEAADGELLRPVNYALRPERYCGLDVDYNPLYDPGVARYPL